MTANADQLAYWNEVAGPKWVAAQERLDRLMAPLTDVLVDAAAARPGEAVLDVGCGCGDLALRLAGEVGAAGRVTGVDVSAPMLAHARVRQAAAEHPVEWLAADAMTHVFAPEYDLLVSRFGVMFFDDRPRAFGNLRRALRAGGRFHVLTWRAREDVEWMQAPLDWLSSLLPPPEDMNGAIGPFALADGPATCDLLEACGFRDIRCRPVDRHLVIGVGLDEAVAMLANTGPAAAALRDLDPDTQRRAVALLRDSLTPHLAEGRVALGGACWLYSGSA